MLPLLSGRGVGGDNLLKFLTFQNGSLYLFDPETDQYVILSEGWEGPRHHHGCLLHIEVQDGRIWVQRDGTEDGIANELVNAGIPKEVIVLGFHEPSVRPHTGFAVA
ncbi:MAG: XisI protein [Synechococcaceae cyanobacterium SM2_3_1]|nr:XisI protein [Synechococcaceae cyanobacterium SM2_3_1]